MKDFSIIDTYRCRMSRMRVFLMSFMLTKVLWIRMLFIVAYVSEEIHAQAQYTQFGFISITL